MVEHFNLQHLTKPYVRPLQLTLDSLVRVKRKQVEKPIAAHCFGPIPEMKILHTNTVQKFSKK
eukprot:6266400-Amphidinium_carterae.1